MPFTLVKIGIVGRTPRFAIGVKIRIAADRGARTFACHVGNLADARWGDAELTMSFPTLVMIGINPAGSNLP